ncbi:MAG: Putative zinc metalloprotease MJ0392 [uncultured Rubrobacteraceae bacterium]|uniref:Zinc metalloprotease n=1 Tax=uncultured Rubrobacteraceae bacterium TaxID=349277 RepID=A0A6J4R187_9ACTN|nr:MAG: Putative zinc metalloprotease MJ0392 [uncultured Rubrobacteraceae bacterium]
MGNSFKIGRFAGIDVKVHWTFFLLLAFFGYIGYGTASQSGVNVALGIAVTIGVILALFLCVVLHEFGHSLVAQKLGIDVTDITLLPIGGVARLKTLPEKPVDEIKIAVAGPLVNVVLAPIFLGLALAFGVDFSSPPGLAAAQQSAGGALFYLGIVNIFLVVFNLIPAFPLDGGRVLRGLLAIRLGPVRATDISAAIGQVLAIALGFLGFATGNLGLILIAIFVFFGASGEQQMVRQRETTRGLDVSDVMGTKRRTETVSPYSNFGQVLDAVIHGYQVDFPVVEEDGRLVGMLTRGEIFSAVHSPDRFRDVRDVMLTDFPTIAPNADLFTEGNRLLQESGLRAIPVMENGELVGMLTVDDIGQANLLNDLRKKPQY